MNAPNLARATAWPFSPIDSVTVAYRALRDAYLQRMRGGLMDQHAPDEFFRTSKEDGYELGQRLMNAAVVAMWQADDAGSSPSDVFEKIQTMFTTKKIPDELGTAMEDYENRWRQGQSLPTVRENSIFGKLGGPRDYHQGEPALMA